LRSNGTTENYLRGLQNGAVQLYYDGSITLATTSTGIDVTGTVTADGLTVDTNTLYVDSTNNRVGIGTTSPNGKLEISGLKNTSELRLSSTTNDASWSADEYFGKLSFYSADTSGAGEGIKGSIITACTGGASGATAHMSFNVASTSSNEIERMRIDASGNVGIGTTSPSTILGGNSLEISNATGSEVIVFRDDGSAVADDFCGGFVIGNKDASGTPNHYAGMWADTDTLGQMTLQFAGGRDKYEAGTADMVIDVNGNVGIGTSNPAESLHTSGNIRFGDTSPAEIYTNTNELRLGVDRNDDNAASDITFYVDNSEKVRIDSSGNVGINTTTPDTALEISVGSTADGLLLSSTNASTSGRLFLQNATAGEGYAILQENGNLDFRSAATAGTSSGTQRVRIDSSGQVGIGTTSPANDLHIASSGTAFATIRLDAPSNTTPATYLLRSHDGDFDIRNSLTSTTALTIDSSGKVGIGTSNPPHKFSVFGSGAGNATVQIEGESGADPYINFLANNTQHWSVGIDDSDSDKFKISEHSGLGTNDYLVVDTTGNVGIGTSSPASILHLLGTDPKITLGVSGAAERAFLQYDNTASLLSLDSDGAIRLSTNNTEALRIDSSGDLLLGTTSKYTGTTANLTVADGIDVGVNDATGGNLFFTRNAAVGSIGSVGGKWTGYSTGPYINFYADNVGGGSQAGSLHFYTTHSNSSSEKMAINSAGRVSVDKSAYIKQVAITSSSGSVAWDTQAAANAYYATTENTTFAAPTNAVEGAIISVEIAQGGTAYTVAWNTVFEFAASTAPTVTATANKTDIFSFRYNGSVWQEIGRTQNLAQT
jgi:hypothetical protein